MTVVTIPHRKTFQHRDTNMTASEKTPYVSPERSVSLDLVITQRASDMQKQERRRLSYFLAHILKLQLYVPASYRIHLDDT